MEKIIISHRGYVNGPNEKANCPVHIQKLLDNNPDLHVEIDLRIFGKELYLGHDGQILYKIEHEFLEKNKDRLWIHCKNFAAAEYMAQFKDKFNWFSHDKDEYCVTNLGYFWFYPEKEKLGDKSIILDFTKNQRILDGFAGICCDYPSLYMTVKV